MPRVSLIALVEDDAALRDALADLLEVVELRCETFADGESFLAAHAPGRFGCLVTDLNLPGASGLQVLERLKALEAPLPVVVISAQSDPAVRAQVLQAGALAYLTKPLNDQVLLRHLTAALGRDTPLA